MKIIALDLGAKTGVAIGDSRGAPICSTEVLGEAGMRDAARFSQALRMTNRLIERHRPDVMVIEEPVAAGVAGGANRVKHAFGYRGAIFGVCHMRGVRVAEYRVETVRKYFIGETKLKRNLAKARVFQACEEMGWAVADHEQSDAAAVWHYARAVLDGVTVVDGLFGKEING